jgi:hypothetical protein
MHSPDGEDPALEELHYLQYTYRDTIGLSHPQLWAAIQNVIQEHQQQVSYADKDTLTAIQTCILDAYMDYPDNCHSQSELTNPSSEEVQHTRLLDSHLSSTT